MVPALRRRRRHADRHRAGLARAARDRRPAGRPRGDRRRHRDHPARGRHGPGRRHRDADADALRRRDPDPDPTPTLTPDPAATATPTPSATPTTTPTPTSTPGSGTVAEWPAGQDGWTVVLASKNGEDAARDSAESFSAEGIPDVGILDSDDFSSLEGGFWVVYSGEFDSQAEATRALDDIDAPDAYIRRITAD